MKPVAQAHGRRARAALLALSLAAYANGFGLGFAYDGAWLALRDARVQAATWANVKLIFTTNYWYPAAEDFLYRPVTTLSFLLNRAALGGGAAGFHCVNVLLHALNVLLLFEVARRVLPAVGQAFAAAALWAVHPVGTEAVANLAGRADLLAAAAVLGGVLIYARGGRARAAAALFTISLAGALAKESAMALIGILGLWDLSFGSAPRRWRAQAYTAAAAALALVFAARAAVFAASPWPAQGVLENPLRGMGFWTARLTALKVLGMDLRLLVWPANLAFDYSYNQIAAASGRDPWVWLTAAVVVETLLVTAVRRRRDPALFFTAGFYALTLLPASNLAVLIGSPMAVRFSYLPAAGFAIAVSALAFRLPRRGLAWALVAAAVAALGARTLARNPAWTSDQALASADAGKAPQSFRVHRLLANALLEADREANLDRAAAEAEKAWTILQPVPPRWNSPQTAADLGLLYELEGDHAGGATAPEGRAWYLRAANVLEAGARMAAAIRQDFDRAQAAHGKPPRFQGGFELLYINLGKAYAALGRPRDAMAAFADARAENPYQPKAYVGLAGAALEAGNLDRAAVAVDEMALLFGIQAEDAGRLRAVYGRIPGGDCALAPERGEVKLNMDCARVVRDVCAAWTDLAAMFDRVHLPHMAAPLRAQARGRGCQ